MMRFHIFVTPVETKKKPVLNSNHLLHVEDRIGKILVTYFALFASHLQIKTFYSYLLQNITWGKRAIAFSICKMASCSIKFSLFSFAFFSTAPRFLENLSSRGANYYAGNVMLRCKVVHEWLRSLVKLSLTQEPRGHATKCRSEMREHAYDYGRKTILTRLNSFIFTLLNGVP